MKEKQYKPSGNNEEAPAKGMAAVNTHSEEEEILKPLPTQTTTERTPDDEPGGEGEIIQREPD
jgi:hypothetical protein